MSTHRVSPSQNSGTHCGQPGAGVGKGWLDWASCEPKNHMAPTANSKTRTPIVNFADTNFITFSFRSCSSSLGETLTESNPALIGPSHERGCPARLRKRRTPPEEHWGRLRASPDIERTSLPNMAIAPVSVAMHPNGKNRPPGSTAWPTATLVLIQPGHERTRVVAARGARNARSPVVRASAP